TDVFFVDTQGRLNVSWVAKGGTWAGPLPISAAGLAPPGAAVAASQQFGLDQTDVFFVDTQGRLNVSWVAKGGTWAGPLPISAAGLAPPGAAVAVASQQFAEITQTVVFLVNIQGRLNIFWMVGSGTWNGPVPIPA